MNRNKGAVCLFCGAPASGVYYFDRGCACYPEVKLQQLCDQHVVKATPLGNMSLVMNLYPHGTGGPGTDVHAKDPACSKWV